MILLFLPFCDIIRIKMPGGLALDFCKAGGFVDSLLFKLGSVAVIFEIVYLAVQMGENWKLFRM